ncbi:hypothetical protein QUB61_36625 [Microcoleus sp. C2D2]
MLALVRLGGELTHNHCQESGFPTFARGLEELDFLGWVVEPIKMVSEVRSLSRLTRTNS